MTQSKYSPPILNNSLRYTKEFNIIELKICSSHRTQNTDRVMQDLVPEVSSARNETTYVKLESRAWRHRSWNLHAHDVDSDITTNSAVVLPPMFHLNHSNYCTKAASLRGEAFKSTWLVICPDTSNTVCSSNYIDHNARHLLEGVNVPANWFLTNRSARTVRDKPFIKTTTDSSHNVRFLVAASQFLFSSV